MEMNEVYLGDLRPDLYWKIVKWCRESFKGSNYGSKWHLDVNTHTIHMSDDFYTLFMLRWGV